MNNYWVIFPSMCNDCIVMSVVPEGGTEDYEYDEGFPLLQDFPERSQSVKCFDLNYEDRIRLYDILPSLDSALVVKSKVKDILEAMEIKDMEYLPICLSDHRRMPVSDDYYILNPMGSLDFIDMKRSQYRLSSLDEGQIGIVKNLVINHNKIPEGARVFRATTKMDLIFIHDDVRKAFEKAGINGYNLVPAEGWDGLGV